MKITLKIALLLFINIVFAQKDKVSVEYTFYDNYFYKEHEVLLISDNKESICKTKYDGNIRGRGKAKFENGNINIAGKNADRFQVTNIQEDTIYEYRSYKKTIVKVKEKIPEFGWDLNYNDSTKINNYQCRKATMTFRGRSYTAWYAKEIPVFSGPWKFNGLPGLILKVEDDTKTYRWEATEIKYPTTKSITIPYEKTESMTLIEYIDSRGKTLEKQRARVRAILPRGSEVSAPKDFRKGIEKIFEWEDTDD